MTFVHAHPELAHDEHEAAACLARLLAEPGAGRGNRDRRNGHRLQRHGVPGSLRAIACQVPSALIGVGRPGWWSFQTHEGAAQFASDDGLEAGVGLATVLALVAERLVAAA